MMKHKRTDIDVCALYIGRLMSAIKSHIAGNSIVWSTVFSGLQQGKHKTFAGLALRTLPVIGKFPSQKDSNEDGASMLCHHRTKKIRPSVPGVFH